MESAKASAVASLGESYPAVPASIPRARARLGRFAAEAGATPEQLEDLRLVISEAVTNVVQHAYRGAPGEVHLSASAFSGELWVLVSDDGCGLRVRSSSPGLGLGMVWIARFTDELTMLERASGGLELRMRFDMHPVEDSRQPAAAGAARVASLC